jgi:hypothetical protein
LLLLSLNHRVPRFFCRPLIGAAAWLSGKRKRQPQHSRTFVMNFADWTHALAERGLRIVAPSHPTPIQVSALIPDGGLVLFRCRGTRVTMERYRASDLLVAAPAANRGCECGRSHGADPLGALEAPRFIVPAEARPALVAAYDGAADRGWSTHEAGLLRPVEAAPLFDTLLARVLGGRTGDGPEDWGVLEVGVRSGWTQRDVVRVRMDGLAGSSL